MAHELLDDVGADQVVIAQEHAAPDRQMTVVDRRVVFLEAARILVEAAPDVTDRTHAEADQVAVAMRRVALEVALHRTEALGPRQVVLGQGEMVESDVAIAGPDQRVGGLPDQGQARGRVGQVGCIDLVLRTKAFRHVRIRVGRDAIRMQGDHLLERLREFLRGLLRQAVDQVDADRAEAVLAGRLDHRSRLLDALHAVDRALHVDVEILDAERNAVEADLGQHAHGVRIAVARIDLDAELAIRRIGQREALVQAFEQTLHLRGIEEVRCAAAEMQLVDRAIGVEHRRGHLDFAQQMFEIAVRAATIARDDARAAAVEARTQAERDMHVDRERARNRVLVRGVRDATQVVFGKALMEMWRGRVRGVARTVDVVARDQLGVEHRCAGELGMDESLGSHGRIVPRDGLARLDPRQRAGNR